MSAAIRNCRRRVVEPWITTPDREIRCFRAESQRSMCSTSDIAVAAADHGSVRRATEALVLRQSTLSRSIRQLEERIGMIVFSRSSGGVRATEAERDLLRVARSIVEQMVTLLTTAHSTGRGEVRSASNRFSTHRSRPEIYARRWLTIRSDFRRSTSA